MDDPKVVAGWANVSLDMFAYNARKMELLEEIEMAKRFGNITIPLNAEWTEAEE